MLAVLLVVNQQKAPTRLSLRLTAAAVFEVENNQGVVIWVYSCEVKEGWSRTTLFIPNPGCT